MSTVVAGTRFGPYELLSPAGAGGMGEVWKACDTRVDRIVAVKISQKQFSERFEREARTTAALNHPNICSLFDVGPDYLVMEFVDGEPIRPTSNVRKLLDLAVQIADGMAAAHDRGVIHRDLKPDNVMVTTEGRVKILDFGLAKQERTSTQSDSTQAVTITDPGLVMGTVSYMSPEQARGLPLDLHSDQFSFGAVLYEIASGKRPFQADSAPQTMAAIIEADPAPLPQTIPPPLRWIVERCLAKDPSARYTSTRDLYRELLSLRDHLSEAMTVSEASAPKSVRKPRGRWPIAAIAVLAAFAIAAAGYLLGWRSGPAPATPIAVVLTSSGGVVLNPSFSPDGTEVVFAWSPGNLHHNLYLKLIGAFDLLRLTKGDADDVSPAWAPDGRQIAFVRNLGQGGRALMLISPLGGSERKLTELGPDYLGPEGHSLLAWTPDGRYLAAANGIQLDLVSVETGEHRPLTFEASAILGDADPAFSSDGKRLAFVRRLGPFTSRLLWFPLNAQYLPAAPPKELQTAGVVAFSPLWETDDRLLFAAGAPFGMHLFRTTVPVGRTTPFGDALVGGSLTLHRNTGRLIYTAPLSIQNLHRLAVQGPGKVSASPERVTSTTGSDFFPRYSPDGVSLAFASYRFGQFAVWAVQPQAPQGSLLAPWGDGLVVPSDWSPDGKSVLMFATGPQGLYQLYRVAVDTRKVTRLLEEPSHDIYPTYSRDGRYIYFTSTNKQSHLVLYKMPGAGGPRTVALDRGVVQATESPDGRWLYFAEYPPGGICRMPLKGGEITRIVEHFIDPAGWELAGSGIYYWTGDQAAPDLHYTDVETRQDRTVFKPAIPAASQLAISPDGRWLCFSLMERNSQELMLIEKSR